MGTGPVGAYKTQTTALLSFAVMVVVVLVVGLCFWWVLF